MVSILSSSRFRRGERRVAKEEYAIVLDFMPSGNPVDRHHPSHRTKPIAQALGDKYFTLVEFYPKPGASLEQGEKVYIGFKHRELRAKVDYVWGEPLLYEDLSAVAKSFLPEAVSSIIKEREEVFVTFFNIASPLTIKLHALELLPGIGKKTMWTILAERQRRPFESFDDLKERGKIVDPVKILTERILSEIRGEERYYLFVEPPMVIKQNTIFLNYLERMYRSLSSS